MKARKHLLKLIKKERVSVDAYTFYFEKPNNLKFLPGQYFKIRLNIDNPDERGTSRYFTISSSPVEKNHLSITTKIVKSSFKKALNNMNPGDLIDFFGPIGYFNFNHKNKRTKIFLAGGIGITPFRSLIKTFAETSDFKIFLFAAFPTKEEVLFFSELKEIEEKNTNIKIIYTLTKENSDRFEKGRINKDLITRYTTEISSSEFFIVGSEKMENELIDMIKNMGVKEENIFSENFTGY